MSFLVNWNELFLACVASSNLGPTVTARAMQTAHTAIFDTWAAFDPTAIGVHSRLEADEALLTPDAYDDALEEAIAYACYTAATAIFPAHGEAIRAFMTDLGFDPDADTSDQSTAAGLGAAAAQAVLEYRASDFSNAAGNFADTTGYTAVNSADPDAPNAPGGPDFDPNRWQPLRVPTGAVLDESGNPTITDDPASYRDQKPLTPQMGEVKSFGLRANDQFRPQAPPQLGDDSEYIDGAGNITTNDQAYRDQFAEILEISGSLTDRQKAIAEFWADGPRSETPPGHWNQLAQDVSARDGNSLEEDVKMFFALNNALLDAAIATWETKFYYDGIRPQSAIRDLYFDQEVLAWAGPNQGSATILGQEWTPYQQATFVTPPFPEYTSGHSSFSMAAATILRTFTGSDTFYDGVTLGRHDLDNDGELDLVGEYIVSTLAFEDYDGEPIVLSWDTFTDAAVEAGLSRRYGGIHIQDGDLFGRIIGSNVAGTAWATSQLYITGSAEALLQSTVGTALGDLLIGTDRGETFNGAAGNDVIRPNGGDDDVTLGAGIDRIEGYSTGLAGMQVQDLEAGESLVFFDQIERSLVEIQQEADGATVNVGTGDIILYGDFSTGIFLVHRQSTDTVITYLGEQPALVDSLTVIDLPPDRSDWTIVAPTGHVGEIGGAGFYVGTAGFQKVTVLDLPGVIRFDDSIAHSSFGTLFVPSGTQTYGPVPGGTGSLVIGTNAGERITLAGDANVVLEASFGRGNDTAVIQGLSTAYAVSASVAGVTITSAAGAHIRIPAFAAVGGVTLEFSDTTLELTTSDGETFRIGDQTITEAPLMIGTGLPPVGPSQGAQIYRGGDLVVLSGDADQWSVMMLDDMALLTDGDTHLTIPFGTSGVLVGFDDGLRTMALDPHTGAAMLGNQLLGDTLTAVSAPPQPIPLPGGGNLAATAELLLEIEGEASVGGNFHVEGTPFTEYVTLLHGDFTFDSSFASGRDWIVFDHAAPNFTAARQGDAVLLEASDTTALIPGTAAVTMLDFDGQLRDLLLTDTNLTIGTQVIGAVATPLIA